MDENIIIVAIVFGSVVGIVALSLLFNLIKTTIKNKNNNTYDEEACERMAQAFIQYKKETTRRLENLEAIVTDEKAESPQKSQKTPSSKQIEIEQKADGAKEPSAGNQNLRNMLRE